MKISANVILDGVHFGKTLNLDWPFHGGSTNCEELTFKELINETELRLILWR